MQRLMSAFTLLILLLSPLAQAADKPAAAAKTAPAKTATAKTAPAQQAVDAREQAMNRLVKSAMEQSLKIMLEQKKPVYPFALLQYKDGRVDSMTWHAVKQKDGKLSPQPGEQEWATTLFLELRRMTATQPDLEVVSLTRMDTVKDKNGKDVLGLWTEVDHRDVRPFIVFMTSTKQKDGTIKFDTENLIYYATEQGIFPRQAKAPAPKAAPATKK